METLRAIVIFGVAGLAEIGGGYLVWRWLREDASVWVGLSGGFILILYGIIPTLQHTDNFGRVYAAYGGVFVILALLWGWLLDGRRPDYWDIAGAIVVALGVGLIFFSPRHLTQ